MPAIYSGRCYIEWLAEPAFKRSGQTVWRPLARPPLGPPPLFTPYGLLAHLHRQETGQPWPRKYWTKLRKGGVRHRQRRKTIYP
jgi:hypothetical protein